MSVFVKFLTEPRKSFASVSTEKPSKMLGSFQATEVLVVKKWQQSDEVSATFTAPYAWVAANIFPSEDPTSEKPELSRARYFSFRDARGEEQVYFLQSYTVSEITGGRATVKVSGGDARVHAYTMTSAPVSSGEDWVGTRSYLLQRLFRSLCNTPRDGMAAWQRLPVSQLGAAPTSEEIAEGFAPISSIEFGEVLTIGAPDPLPVGDSIQEVYGYLPDSEVAPVLRWGFDHTASPWWQWMLRSRVTSRALFSEADGSLIVNNSAGSNEQTETMSYSSKDYVQARYAAGENQGRTNLRGPWAGFAVDSASPPEGANVKNFLTSRARSATLKNKRVTFDFTLNFSKKSIKPIIGMTTFIRLGDLVYRVNVDEIASSYSSESGWLTTAPVFLSQDSVKVASIKDGPYIEFVVNTTGAFSIPTSGGSSDTFKWTVETDGVFYGEYTGVSSISSAGIPLTFSEPGQHTVKIYDTSGEYKVGWARAFGFRTVSSGANNSSNKNKLIAVAKDPDWGHLLSSDNTGYNFRQQQFYGCGNLESSYTEAMPSSVKTIGINAYGEQYYNCTKLQAASPESMGSGVELELGLYRAAQYYGCTALEEAAIEDCSERLASVGNQFRVQQYQRSGIRRAHSEKFYGKTIGARFREAQFADCEHLISTGAEAFDSSATFGTSFRYKQYYNCRSLLSAATEAYMQGESTTPSSSTYREAQYESCTSLLEAADEKSSVTVSEYRVRQYANCVSLLRAASESTGVSLKKIGASAVHFKLQQYTGCSSLTEAAVERAPTLLSSVNSYRKQQFYNCVELLASPAEDFIKHTGSDYLYSYREAQYQGCLKLTSAGGEAFDYLVISSSNVLLQNFRYRQYKGCVNLIDPPTVNSGYGKGYENFRSEQFMGCSKLTSMQPEFDVMVVNSALVSQYENCSSLVNNDSSLTERYYVTSVYGSFRNRQFYGCSSMKYPLLEPTTSLTALSTSVKAFRKEQYSYCVSLLATATEQPVVFTGGTGGVFGDYRTAQYKGCSSLLPSSFTQPKLEIGTRQVSGGSYQAAFRGNQFQDTPASNVAGNRVKFSDGVEAVPGVNVPNDIY